MFWWIALGAIIAAGIASRAVHTGNILADKYLGDALYAAMVYVLFRIWGRCQPVVIWAAGAMAAIELFQLTGIPAAMHQPANPAVIRIAGRLLGTEFAWADMAAYAVGIAAIALADRAFSGRRN